MEAVRQREQEAAQEVEFNAKFPADLHISIGDEESKDGQDRLKTQLLPFPPCNFISLRVSALLRAWRLTSWRAYCRAARYAGLVAYWSRRQVVIV